MARATCARARAEFTSEKTCGSSRVRSCCVALRLLISPTSKNRSRAFASARASRRRAAAASSPSPSPSPAATSHSAAWPQNQRVSQLELACRLTNHYFTGWPVGDVAFTQGRQKKKTAGARLLSELRPRRPARVRRLREETIHTARCEWRVGMARLFTFGEGRRVTYTGIPGRHAVASRGARWCGRPPPRQRESPPRPPVPREWLSLR